MKKGLFLIFFLTIFIKPICFSENYSSDLTSSNGKGIPYPKINYNSGYSKELIDQGEYLAKVGDCISCHTNDPSLPFSGNLPMNVRFFGTFYTPNITPDKKTGIGLWTDEQFIKTMHKGINPQGKNYYPVFPYLYFNKVTKEDLLAIKAYLFSIPPIQQIKKEDDINFPFDWRALQWVWKALFFFPNEGTFQKNHYLSQEYNRGAYLVEGLGHCSMCHTPTNFLGAPIHDKYLQGNEVEHYYAPDLTTSGWGGYSVKDLVTILKKGTFNAGQGKVVGPMSEVIHNSLSYLTDDDLKAIAIYLKNIPGLKLPKTPEDIYETVCSHCHKKGIEGAPKLNNKAYWKFIVKSKTKDGLIESAIKGINNMPPKGGCSACTDKEIEAVVEYMLSHSIENSENIRFEVFPDTPPAKDTL